MKKLVSSLCAGVFLSALGCGGDNSPSTVEADSSAPSASKDAAANDANAKPDKDAGARNDAADSRPPVDAGGDGSNDDTANLPSVVDCTDPGQSGCFAAAIVRGGVQLTCTAGPEAVGKVVLGTPTWSIYCEDGSKELSVQVEFPVQGPGSLNYSTTPGSPSDLKFSVSWVNAAAARNVGDMNDLSTNLKSGHLVGTVGADNQLTGTLTAAWSAPAADCNSGEGAYPCKQGALKATFNLTAF